MRANVNQYANDEPQDDQPRDCLHEAPHRNSEPQTHETENNPNLGDKLTQLANGVLDELLRDPGSLEQRMDAIKVIGTLHLGLKKISGKMAEEDDPNGASLRAIRERVKAAEGK